MKIRKTYLLVKLPISRPEHKEDESPDKSKQVKISKHIIEERFLNENFKTENKAGREPSPISLDNKFANCKYRFWVQGFPGAKNHIIDRKIHTRSFSNVKNSITPVRLRNYVESILDMKDLRSQREFKKNFSAMNYVKRGINEGKKSVSIHGRLLPILKANIKM